MELAIVSIATVISTLTNQTQTPTVTPTKIDINNIYKKELVTFPDRSAAANEAKALDAQREAERVAALEAEQAALSQQTYNVATYTETPVIQPVNGFVGGENGYSYGQCTYYVASRRNVPGGWGNAANWIYGAQASGFPTGQVPQPGAIGVGKGINHVVYIESVNGDMVTVSEMNYVGWNVVSTRTAPASAFNYIY